MYHSSRGWVKRFYPWIVWVLGALFLFYKYILEVSPSVMTAPLMRDFQLTGTSMGNLAAMYYYAYMCMQIPMGIFTDRFGPRYVTTASIILCAMGAVVMSFTHNIYIAEIARFMTGFGAAVAAISSLKLTTLWFPQNRFAFMAGLMMFLAMMGSITAEAPLSILMSHVGWRTALLSIGIVGLVFAFFYWLFVRDDGPHAPEPYSVGDTHRMPILAGIKEVLSSKQSWLLSAYSGLAFAPVSVFGGLWGVPFLMSAFHVTRTHAANEVSMVFFGFALGSPIWGWFSDKMARRMPIMFWGTLVAFITATMVILVPGLADWMVMSLLFMFGLGISCFLLCFTMIRQVNRLLLAATAIGFMNSFDALLGAVSDPFIGRLLDLSWDGTMHNGARYFSAATYREGLLVIPLYLLVSMILLKFVKETGMSQK